MNDVAVGEVGEVVHRSPHLMTGYWRDEEKTAAAFAGGWFHSGDLATIDAEGYITIVDRKKDMIKTGGENVSSREVEEAIYLHPGVAETAVIGTPDPVWVEAVTAIVVAREGHDLDEAGLIAHCKTRLSGFKVPKRVIVVDALPRNASGKILKRELRELA
jgi:fatty-acyl-CoA synthase